MTNPPDIATPPPFLRSRLSVMMFLQYAIWGSWLPLFYSFLTEHRGLEPGQAGMLFSIGATGALIAPFVAGQIADRRVSSQKFLGVLHLAGAALVWQLSQVTTFEGLLIFSFVYSILYSPTLPLTNSLALHHLPDRDRDFGKVRVFGTIGWIAVGIGVGQWLLSQHTPATGTKVEIRAAQVAGMADSFQLSAILGLILGIYSFTLPDTPPRREKKDFAPFAALSHIRRQPLISLFCIAFPVSCIHQFYFVHTAGFLGTLKNDAADGINQIFGVGGGGLMTIGQMSEILILAVLPFVSKFLSRKSLLCIGLLSYTLRFMVFAYFPTDDLVIPALALHGLCFGCFIFVAFLIVDEETPKDLRASAQGLFNFVIIGLGVIVGNAFSGWIGDRSSANHDDGSSMDYENLFGIPMWIAAACLALAVVFYPPSKPPRTETA